MMNSLVSALQQDLSKLVQSTGKDPTLDLAVSMVSAIVVVV
jgi:hypothetical protein